MKIDEIFRTAIEDYKIGLQYKSKLGKCQKILISLDFYFF